MKTPTARFEALYNSNKNDLFAYIIRSVREENTAHDILQDAFLNFFNAYKDKEAPNDTQCRMYLFTIARNLIINNANRAYNRRVDLVADYSGNERSISSKSKQGLEDGVLDKMEIQDAEETLRELLEDLTEDERTALLLRYDSGLRLEDLAQIMEISTSTASRLVRKAAKNLVELGKKKGLNPETLNFSN